MWYVILKNISLLIIHQEEGLVGPTLFAKDNLLESVNIGQLEQLLGANLDIFGQTFDKVSNSW